jgi:hypothetical protein
MEDKPMNKTHGGATMDQDFWEDIWEGIWEASGGASWKHLRGICGELADRSG